MNISNSISELNFPSVGGVGSAKIYAWPNYRQASVERVNPVELDVFQNSIQVLLPKEEREEIARSFMETKNESFYTPNGKNFAAGFAVVGTLFDAII